MEKAKFNDVYIDYNGDYDRRERAVDDFELYSFPIMEAEKYLQIAEGKYQGKFLTERDGDVLFCEHPLGVWDGGMYRDIVLPEYESIEDARRASLAALDLSISNALIESFLDGYVFVKSHLKLSKEDADQITMSLFATYCPILPKGVFHIKANGTSAKGEAYKTLEHLIDKQYKERSAEERAEIKEKERDNLAELIAEDMASEKGE